MNATLKQVREDALDWVNGEERTEEWDADVVIMGCVNALTEAEARIAALGRMLKEGENG